jgi:tetratricopeptide (TPR) repeat protein
VKSSAWLDDMNGVTCNPLDRGLAWLLMLLISGCANYSPEPPNTLLTPQKASSILDNKESLLKARLGTVKIRPFSTDVVDTPQLLNRSDWPEESRSWLRFFALVETSFGAGLRTLLEAPNLFDRSSKIAMNVQVELVSLKEELELGFVRTQHSHPTVRYVFKAENVGFALAKEVTSHGTFAKAASTQGHSPVEGMEIALTQNLAELGRLLKSEISAEFHQRYTEFTTLTNRAEQAEKNGDYRKAFQLHTEWSSSHEINADIIKRIINLYHKLDPPPAIPEEARKLAIFAETATKLAKDEKDYDKAIAEYVKVIKLAPWWADIFVNLALLQEKTGRFSEAVESLKLYLIASPYAPDEQKIRTKIYELEYKAKAG